MYSGVLYAVKLTPWSSNSFCLFNIFCLLQLYKNCQTYKEDSVLAAVMMRSSEVNQTYGEPQVDNIRLISIYKF